MVLMPALAGQRPTPPRFQKFRCGRMKPLFGTSPGALPVSAGNCRGIFFSVHNHNQQTNQ